ncbi:hypothetical protein BGX31_005903 [Mortierella sp. GBA43]|nr:hypothetical protein BGX31_005903 [Mortierella sp. GBA43]
MPGYGFFIMNRLGLDNLKVDITGDMALQLTSDYIIYKDEKDIHGIWIYEPTDRDRIGEKLLECRKMAKEAQDALYAQVTSPSSITRDQALSPSSAQSPTASIQTTSGSSDPLTRMLSEAMSKARVSETSGTPLQPQGDGGIRHADPLANSSSTVQQQASTLPGGSVQTGSTGGEVPSFLLAILSKEKDQPTGSSDVSSSAQHPGPKEMGSTQAMLLNSLTGATSPPSSNERRDSRSNGPPLSAEFLPPSVMPSGLYSNSAGANVVSNSGVFTQQTNEQGAPSPAMGAAKLLNRSNGIPPHGSPMQAPAFAYSPGMMPSPLLMPPMPGGPLMRPPPPPMPFQHPMMGPSMGMPPPQQPPHAGSTFPADAMHAAMGAVGFMQQQQRGFVSQGSEVLSKAEFSQQFLGLLRSDPQFMDVLYTNYTAVLARRG